MKSLPRSQKVKAELEDIDRLEVLARNIKTAALCGLGQTAPNPMYSQH